MLFVVERRSFHGSPASLCCSRSWEISTRCRKGPMASCHTSILHIWRQAYCGSGFAAAAKVHWQKAEGEPHDLRFQIHHHKNIESAAKEFSLEERFRSRRQSCKVIQIFCGRAEQPVLPGTSFDQHSNFRSLTSALALARLQTRARSFMINRIGLVVLIATGSLWIFAFKPVANAQQTLGGITGTVSDKSGGVLPETTVTIVGDQTTLTRSQKTNANGSYDFVNLPIGTYTITFTHEGFQTQKVPSITVQADRTATFNATLPVGQVGTVVEVQADPLMNAVDTTNGYILEKDQIDSIPLPTGSFTGLAILSPGVNAELPNGSGANAGLGNQPIWANGQRDTSNTFLLNGVDASNLFNGKSTSQVASARIVNNTGIAGAGSTTAEIIQSTASPYLAIGQALPTPAPETVQEFRVNTSMYDAQQGSTSGAHIDMSTASGSNAIHGQAYIHRGTDWLNAAPYFYNRDANIPPNQQVPQLHRYTAGGTIGAPIIKDKLFGFVSYQHIHVSDTEIGTSRTAVPTGLTDDRSPAALASVVLNNWGTVVQPVVAANSVSNPPATPSIDPVAYALLTAKLPNGQYLFPWANPNYTPTLNFPENVFLTQPAYFISDQAVADLDYLATTKDTLSLKYYYQHDPTTAPFGYSSVEGFPQHLDAGSQVASITNTQTIRPNLSVTED